MAVYYATKAYVLSLSVALTVELEGTGVSVTALCPGPTTTGFQEVAGVKDSRLFKMGAMAVEPVARAGYRGMMKGTPIVVPGLRNKALGVAAQVSPRYWTAKIAGWMHVLRGAGRTGNGER
jgi:short-subunit dehydrogenase